jgi:hypothetical protein
LTASIPMRIGPLFWAKTRWGAVMPAIPAPATLETNCRRDIVTESSPERGNRISGHFID